ncbi:serine hydrolase [Candidatus Woesearchaeota archaeon]|nr:serine hydrolase [Candidatus Woesearchaeota archaeon]
MDRREAVTRCLIGLGGIALGLSPTMAESRNERNERYDVSYLWTPNIEDALDYMEEVGGVLGQDLQRELHVVRAERTGMYGVVYDRNTTRSSAVTTAYRHSGLLTKADLDPASIVEDKDYYDLYNIVYGTGPNLEVHRANFAKVVAQLGPELAKDLVIEERRGGTYALVYQRRGEKESTYQVAQDHARRLKSIGITADISIENNHDVIYSNATYLDHIVQTERDGDAHVRKTEKESTRDLVVIGEITTPRETQTSSTLENDINTYIQQLRRQGRLDHHERTAWSVYDLTANEKLVSLNEDLSLQTASMVKPFVALAFFHEVEKGRLSYGQTSRKKMEAMIQRSNNNCTNWVMGQVGGPRTVERILRQNYGSLFNQLCIVEYIPSNGRCYANMASAHDYSRFLYALWHDELPFSREIKRLMALPNRDRLYDGAREVPQGTLVYDKTGTTAMLCGDFGLLVARGEDGRKYPYTLVGIIERKTRARNLGSFMRTRGDIIRGVSNKTYHEMKRRHALV